MEVREQIAHRGPASKLSGGAMQMRPTTSRVANDAHWLRVGTRVSGFFDVFPRGSEGLGAIFMNCVGPSRAAAVKTAVFNDQLMTASITVV